MAEVTRKGFRDKNGKQVKIVPDVPGATSGDFASFDAEGNLQDSGKKASDFAGAIHIHEEIQKTDMTLGGLSKVRCKNVDGDGSIKFYVQDGQGEVLDSEINTGNIDNLNRALKTPSSVPEDDATKLITSKAVYEALAGKMAAASSVNLVYDSEGGWTVEGNSVLQNMSWNTVTPLWFNLQVTLQSETIKAKILGSAYKYLGGQDDTLILDFVVDGELFKFEYQGLSEQDAESYQFDISESVTLTTTNIFPSVS